MKLKIIILLTILYFIEDIIGSEEALPKETFCSPGQIFKDKCNTCKCALDGATAACTEMQCVTWEEEQTSTEKQICVPGSQFKKDCNDCFCSSDGTSVACTKKACR